MRVRGGPPGLFRSFSARLLAVAGGLLLVAGLIVVLSVPQRATPGSAAVHRNARTQLWNSHRCLSPRDRADAWARAKRQEQPEFRDGYRGCCSSACMEL